MSQCVVSAKDYARYFEGRGAIELPVLIGDERRVSGIADRRANAHERRFHSTRGRRYRLGDRRQITRPR